MIDPYTRELYEWAEKNAPDLYASLCDADRHIAAHAAIGMAFLNHRRHLFEVLVGEIEQSRIFRPVESGKVT